MNWRALASSIFDYLDQVPSPKWLGIAATCVSLVLLIGLIVLSDRYLRLRRRVAVQGEGDPAQTATVGWEDELAPISLEGERRALIDRVLPRRPRTFLLAVGTLAVACWAGGLALATDAHAFLTSRELPGANATGLMAPRPHRVQPDDMKRGRGVERLGRLPLSFEGAERAGEARRERVRNVMVARNREHRRPQRAEESRRIHQLSLPPPVTEITAGDDQLGFEAVDQHGRTALDRLVVTRAEM